MVDKEKCPLFIPWSASPGECIKKLNMLNYKGDAEE